MHGANLSFAFLNNANLAGAIIDDKTNLEHSNWWASDFYVYWETDGVDKNLGVDEDLLEKLYARYADAVPKDLNELHQSVQSFIEKKRQEE